MGNKELKSPQDLQIQGLIDGYLRSQISSGNDDASRERHLDEDSLAAFTEGSLREREAQPIIAHLVNCSYCRRVTAELIKLDLAFAQEEIEITAAVEHQPSKISDVLNGLLSRIFQTNDGAVFAHQEKEEREEAAAEEKKK